LSFIKLLSLVVLPVLTHIFNHIFVSSSLLVCLSKVFKVVIARQMERHICWNNLQTVFQFGCVEGDRKHSAEHGLLLCKLQNAQSYLVGAVMLVGSYIMVNEHSS
jgi:hypothetical protein